VKIGQPKLLKRMSQKSGLFGIPTKYENAGVSEGGDYELKYED
jgi:hypothetical protein